MNKEIRIKDWN